MSRRVYIAIASVLLLLGFSVTLIGFLFRVMHWPGSAILINLGIFSAIVGLPVFIWFVFLKKED